MNKGRFVIIEGRDGIGKTYLIKALEKQLNDEGFKTKVFRDPGGTEIGELLRTKTKEYDDIDKIVQMQLFNASRTVLFKDKMEPALKEGYFVLCDRNFLSTIVYEEVCEAEVDFARALFKDYCDDMITIVLSTDNKEQLQKNLAKDNSKKDHLDLLDQNLIDIKYRRAVEHWHELIDIGSIALVNLTYDRQTDVKNVNNTIKYIIKRMEEDDVSSIYMNTAKENISFINKLLSSFKGGVK